MCCTRLAGNTGRKNDAKNRHLRTIAQLCRAISPQLRHVSTFIYHATFSSIKPWLHVQFIACNLLHAINCTCNHGFTGTCSSCWRRRRRRFGRLSAVRCFHSLYTDVLVYMVQAVNDGIPREDTSWFPDAPDTAGSRPATRRSTRRQTGPGTYGALYC